ASHFNVGAVYRAASWADLNLSYERGNTLMFGFTLRTNFNDLRPALRDTPKPAYQPAPESEGLQYTTVANQLTAFITQVEICPAGSAINCADVEMAC
ncbi:YjbH domain-containing protein, partial [Escherichia sp. HC-CC]